MQPQQPSTPQTPANYDFIMNPTQPPRQSLFGGGSSMATRLLVVVGGLFVLMVVVVLFLQLLGSGGGSFDKTAMLTVAQDQTEIVRLGERGHEDSVNQTAKNLAMTASLSIKTDNADLTDYLAKHGYKINSKQLAVSRSSATDTQLDNAKSASNFDPTYRDIMKTELQNYQKDLTTAYNSTKSQSGKAVIKTQYDHARLLVTLVTDTNQ